MGNLDKLIHLVVIKWLKPNKIKKETFESAASNNYDFFITSV